MQGTDHCAHLGSGGLGTVGTGVSAAVAADAAAVVGKSGCSLAGVPRRKVVESWRKSCGKGWTRGAKLVDERVLRRRVQSSRLLVHHHHRKVLGKLLVAADGEEAGQMGSGAGRLLVGFRSSVDLPAVSTVADRWREED